MDTMKKIAVLTTLLFLMAGNGYAADQTIAATEEMVGSGHATKSDTLNRLTLVGHNTDGTHKAAVSTTTGTLTIDETVSLSSKAPKASPTFTGNVTLSGNVTNATLPSFLVRPSAEQLNVNTGAAVPISFDTEVFDRGTNFAANTFTAPITGNYQLSFNLVLIDVDSAAGTYTITLVTSNRNYATYFDVSKFSADIPFWSITLSVLADMDAADSAYVAIQAGGTAQTDISTSSYFSGYLVD